MVFELPAALALRVAHPNHVYGGAVVFFGLCAACTAVSGGYAGLMVLRLFLGFGESFVQTGFVFISLWYKRNEITTRCGVSHSPNLAFLGLADSVCSLFLWRHTHWRGIRRTHRLRC